MFDTTKEPESASIPVCASRCGPTEMATDISGEGGGGGFMMVMGYGSLTTDACWAYKDFIATTSGSELGVPTINLPTVATQTQ